MTDREIVPALADLRAEIEQLDKADAATRERLEELVDRLEQQLTAAELGQHQLHLVEDIKDAITEFEVEHPRMTGILNDIMVTLSNLGI
ncbi:MAG: DUF4404 family protein [Gammaproteobacteria bacterium]|nr:DUF4404 family protein [Gammaproteobacteria bacterium]